MTEKDFASLPPIASTFHHHLEKMAPHRLQVAVAGLGRMGKRHAINFLNRVPRAELKAAFSPDPAEVAWAKANLEPWGVRVYDDFDAMLGQQGLEALVIGTATSVHAEEAIKGIDRGLHVLCEKPLSTDINVVCKHLTTSTRDCRMLAFASSSTNDCTLSI